MAGAEALPARVLIVDDDPDTRAMTAAALQERYDVVCATTSGEALRHVRARVPDAIVVDVMLGPESGWELIRVLQADPACRRMPIVVLSGARHLEPPRGVRPCAAHLRKPCRMVELRAVLTQLLVELAASESP